MPTTDVDIDLHVRAYIYSDICSGDAPNADADTCLDIVPDRRARFSGNGAPNRDNGASFDITW